MPNHLKVLSLLVVVFTQLNLHAVEDGHTTEDALQLVRNAMINIIVDNENFQSDPAHTEEYFRKQAAGQKPRVTIIGCSDSRVHTSNFDQHPLGDVFFIRNIGNQIETCMGSLDYGVHHLKTPLVLILGHSECGAVKAVTKGTEGLEDSIKEELEPMRLGHLTRTPTAEQIKENINENVRNQVNKACCIYSDLISDKRLWVVGAVYDFTPEGRGKFTVLQVNSRTDSDTIAKFLEDVEKHGDYYNDPGRSKSQ